MRPRLRAGHLGQPRPVPARRAVTGDVRLVVVGDAQDRAVLLAIGSLAATAIAVLGVGIAVIA